MPRKRDAPPEQLLQRVIVGLEDDAPLKHRGAVLALLGEGPFLCVEALIRVRQRFEEGLEIVDGLPEHRAGLLGFLRTLVRVEGPEDEGQAAIGTAGPLVFTGRTRLGYLDFYADGDVRDLLVLQLVLLVHAVGLRNVRRCGADCPHLFVKTYRREYCSVRCQQRAYKREQRAHERREQIRARQRRRVTKGQS